MQKVFMFWLLSIGSLMAQTPRNQVMVVEIRSEIDGRMARFVKLGLERAEKTGADEVIIDMNTYGGALTDAMDIVELLLAFKKPVWVFVNPNAASAGAFISIACDSIYMSPGATIGAATVVQGESGQAAPDKYQSYMRSKMRATAIIRHRDPRIAEGMVDERTVIDSIKESGKVITFTTSEAIQHHYCEASVHSIQEILERNKITNYDLRIFQLSAADLVIAFFMNPLISGILILVILAGIYFEFQAPGSFFPIAAAVIALLLYLVPYYLNGLAENWEILLLFVGIVLVLAEIFVVPGFGITGISGVTFTVAALIFVMVKNDFLNFNSVPAKDLLIAGTTVLGGICGAIAMLFVAGARLSKTKAFGRLALTHTQQASHGYTVQTINAQLNGEKGVAWTVLRPSGKVMISDQVYDAFTRGEFIEKGSEIVVVSAEGISLQVRSVG